VPPSILVSAGEASGDLYASALVTALRRIHPEVAFFGCTGERMRAAGVETVVDAASLSVVGLVEVVKHIPRIYGEFRKLLRATKERRPQLAILTDSPDFHLRLAKKLKRLGIPVIYLIAPQVWAWRTGRVKQMRRDLERVLCIFPFEKDFFDNHRVPAEYIGHPLAWIVKPRFSRTEFLKLHELEGQTIVALLPGSRLGEVARHLPHLLEAAERMERPGLRFVLALPRGFRERAGSSFFKERIARASIQVVEGDTWDVLAHADLALAASGTVTVEAALLGTPMVTFYRVTPLSWFLGRKLVKVPFLTMVNLVAGQRVVPELMQNDATGERLATEALALLDDSRLRDKMKCDLAEVSAALTTGEDPMERAAHTVSRYLSNGNNANCA
jgi:lipid-A-disaccharide synthase